MLLIFNQYVWSQSILSSVNGNCTLNYEGRILNEGQSIEIRGKLYKVEECGIHRAYHACGSYLLQMVSIACDVLSKQKRNAERNRFRRSLKRRFLQRKLLTEACCETLCTVAEMTRYCP